MVLDFPESRFKAFSELSFHHLSPFLKTVRFIHENQGILVKVIKKADFLPLFILSYRSPV